MKNHKRFRHGPSSVWNHYMFGSRDCSFESNIRKLRWPNTVFARAFADAIERARTRIAKSDHFIYSTPALSVLFFLYHWTQCIDGFSLLLQRYVRKGNDAKKPAILSFLFVTERTQLNAAHAQLLEILRPIAFAETCGFLTIQSFEFQEIWQKNSSETT